MPTSTALLMNMVVDLSVAIYGRISCGFRVPRLIVYLLLYSFVRFGLFEINLVRHATAVDWTCSGYIPFPASNYNITGSYSARRTGANCEGTRSGEAEIRPKVPQQTRTTQP